MPDKPAPKRRRAPSPLAVITASLGLFFVVLTLLAIQVRSGRDPALGPGIVSPAAITQPAAGKGGTAAQARKPPRSSPVPRRCRHHEHRPPAVPDERGPSLKTRVAPVVILVLAGMAAYTMFSGPTIAGSERRRGKATRARSPRGRGAVPGGTGGWRR